MSKDKHRAAEAAEEFINDARARADEAIDRAEKTWHSAHEAIDDGIDDAHRFMKRQWRQRPLAVAASAMGIGLALGLLLGSGRR